jgi:hypothetical protein
LAVDAFVDSQADGLVVVARAASRSQKENGRKQRS